MKSLSRIRLFATPWTAAYQAPPIHGIFPGKSTGVGCHCLLLDSILKSRDITLPTNVHLVKAMVFPLVMYRCESWAIKKAEHRRIVDFELWCRRRLLRVPCTARRSNLKEIHPKGDQSWVFIGGTDAKAETPVLWPPHAKS